MREVPVEAPLLQHGDNGNFVADRAAEQPVCLAADAHHEFRRMAADNGLRARDAYGIPIAPAGDFIICDTAILRVTRQIGVPAYDAERRETRRWKHLDLVEKKL